MFRGLSNMFYTQTPKTKRLMAYHCNFDTINVVEHRSQGFHLRSMLLHLLHDCNVLKCLHCPGFEGWQRLNQNKCGYDNTCNILEEIGASWLHQIKCPDFSFEIPLSATKSPKSTQQQQLWPCQPWHFRWQYCKKHLGSTCWCVYFDLNCPQIDSAEKLGWQKQQRQQPKVPAPAASSAHNKTTPCRREALGARPAPAPAPRQTRDNGGPPKQTTQAKPEGKSTKTWPPQGTPRGSQRKRDNLKGGCTRAKPKQARLPDQAHGNNNTTTTHGTQKSK